MIRPFRIGRDSI